ncbi:hypothetical protein LCGC14_2176860, partial [marine sediment metagenome]
MGIQVDLEDGIALVLAPSAPGQRGILIELWLMMGRFMRTSVATLIPTDIVS